MQILGTRMVKGHKKYIVVWPSGEMQTLGLSDILPYARNGKVENAKVRKVYGRETIVATEGNNTYDVKQCNKGNNGNNGSFEQSQLANYVREAAAKGVKILDLGPIQVDTSTFQIRPSMQSQALSHNKIQVKSKVKAQEGSAARSMEEGIIKLARDICKNINTSLLTDNEAWVLYEPKLTAVGIAKLSSNGCLSIEYVTSNCQQIESIVQNHLQENSVIRISPCLHESYRDRILQSFSYSCAHHKGPIQITTNIFEYPLDVWSKDKFCSGIQLTKNMFKGIIDMNTAVPVISASNRNQYMDDLEKLMNPSLRRTAEYGIITHLLNYRMILKAEAAGLKEIGLTIAPDRIAVGVNIADAKRLYEKDLQIKENMRNVMNNIEGQLKVCSTAHDVYNTDGKLKISNTANDVYGILMKYKEFMQNFMG